MHARARAGVFVCKRPEVDIRCLPLHAPLNLMYLLILVCVVFVHVRVQVRVPTYTRGDWKSVCPAPSLLARFP